MPSTKGKKYGFGKSRIGHELELPSHSDPDNPKSPHNVVLVRRPGVQGLIAAGVLDNFDSLTSLVQKEHIERASGKAEFEKAQEAAKPEVSPAVAILSRREDLIAALSMVDKVVLYCVMEPKLYKPVVLSDAGEEIRPMRDEERDPDKTYVDEVDLDDRMFILQYAMGGSKDLESFRQETGGGLAGLEAQQKLQGTAVDAVRN